MQDISNEIGHAKVAEVVDTFYNSIERHPVLRIPFASVQDWPTHKQHLTHFWWVSLGGDRYLDYQYQVPAKHESAGFTPELLAIWLDLFRKTVRGLIPEELAAPWIKRAERIGTSLNLMQTLPRAKITPIPPPIL